MVTAAQAHQNLFLIPPHALAEWRELAEAIDEHGAPVCATAIDPDAWWQQGRFAEALEGCAGCSVDGECLSYALAAGERYGVWGGQLPEARRQIAASR